jgi:hypothetical protein
MGVWEITMPRHGGAGRFRSQTGGPTGLQLLLRRPGYYVLASRYAPVGAIRRPIACTEVAVLNRTDRPAPMPGEAEVKYLDGDFRVVRPGTFVRCAVTGASIPLEELRYWSVDLQEAYATPEAVLQRLGTRYGR